MINALVNYGAHRLMSFGLVALGVGGFYVYDQYDKKTNFVPVQARVTNVQELCYLEKRSGRTTSSSDTLACDKAQYLSQNHPRWQGFSVRYKIAVDYDYVSPVDNRTHFRKAHADLLPRRKKDQPWRNLQHSRVEERSEQVSRELIIRPAGGSAGAFAALDRAKVGRRRRPYARVELSEHGEAQFLHGFVLDRVRESGDMVKSHCALRNQILIAERIGQTVHFVVGVV